MVSLLIFLNINFMNNIYNTLPSPGALSHLSSHNKMLTFTYLLDLIARGSPSAKKWLVRESPSPCKVVSRIRLPPRAVRLDRFGRSPVELQILIRNGECFERLMLYSFDYLLFISIDKRTLINESNDGHVKIQIPPSSFCSRQK